MLCNAISYGKYKNSPGLLYQYLSSISFNIF